MEGTQKAKRENYFKQQVGWALEHDSLGASGAVP